MFTEKERVAYEQARAAFIKLQPKKNDIIVVNLPHDIMYEQMRALAPVIEQIREEFDCTVLIVTDGIEISVLSEEEMSKHGWYKIDRCQIH